MNPCFLYIICLIVLAGCDQIKSSFKPFSEDEVMDLTVYDSLSLSLNNEAVRLLNRHKIQRDTNSIRLLDESLILIDSAITLDDSYPLLYYNKVQILANLSKVDSALFTCGMAIKKYPKNPYLFLARGFLSAKQGNLDDALNDFRHSYFLFEITNSIAIQLDIETKEIVFMLGFGKNLAEIRLDSLIKCKEQVFYDRRLKKHILSLELDSLTHHW